MSSNEQAVYQVDKTRMDELLLQHAQHLQHFQAEFDRYTQVKAQGYEAISVVVQRIGQIAQEFQVLLRADQRATPVEGVIEDEDEHQRNRASIMGRWMASVHRRLEFGRGSDAQRNEETGEERIDQEAKQFAELLLRHREDRHLDRKQLAKLSSVPELYLLELEKGIWAAKFIDAKYVKDLASALGADVEEFNKVLGRLSSTGKEEDIQE